MVGCEEFGTGWDIYPVNGTIGQLVGPFQVSGILYLQDNQAQPRGLDCISGSLWEIDGDFRIVVLISQFTLVAKIKHFHLLHRLSKGLITPWLFLSEYLCCVYSFVAQVCQINKSQWITFSWWYWEFCSVGHTNRRSIRSIASLLSTVLEVSK